MYGDFSRLTFNAAKSYTAVWSQQGRIQLDADQNEQTAIMLDWLRQLATDFIGPAGGHLTRAGFEITLKDNDLVLKPGHYYVCGIRCEIPATGADGQPVTVSYTSLKTPDQPAIPTAPYLVHLRVWERSVNWLQDPALREPALGPTAPDTTVRSQVAWSLAFITDNLPTDADATKIDEAVDAMFTTMNTPTPQPLLWARAEDPDDVGAGGYLGLENQLYRFEIHHGNDASVDDATATFKWSRDNGSVEFGIDPHKPVGDGDDHRLIHLAPAALPGRPTLEVGDCVEIIDASWEPFGTPGRLYRIDAVNPEHHTVTLDHGVEDTVRAPALLRRWDGICEDNGSPVVAPDDLEDGWIPIENGIQVRFSPPKALNPYRRGDYWLISARADTGQIYGPATAATGAPAYGPQRHYAPLALVRANEPIHDLRSLFTQLAWPEAEKTP